jgi:hypothetical protein
MGSDIRPGRHAAPRGLAGSRGVLGWPQLYSHGQGDCR